MIILMPQLELIKILRQKLTATIDFPPYSPDFDPNEYEQGSMKDYIQCQYPRMTGEARDHLVTFWRMAKRVKYS